MIRRPAGPSRELATLITQSEPPDVGSLVRALARAVVHVPMPGEPELARPRTVDGTREAPALYVVEDEDGGHALLYTTPERLVTAWGPTTAASVPMVTLLQGWPPGVDAVLDAGHAEALVVPVEVLRDVALHCAGVPTASALRPSSAGVLARRPEPTPVHVLSAARGAASTVPEVRALSCAEVLDLEPDARPVLTVVVDLSAVDEARLSQVMGGLVEVLGSADPRPLRLVAVVEGRVGDSEGLVDAVRTAVEPFWQRPPG